MSNAARRLVVTPEMEAAIADAASHGERLVLVNGEGRALGAIEAHLDLPDDLALAFAAVRAKLPDELTDADEDVLDAVAALRARAEWEADGRRTVSWESVKASFSEE